MGASESSKNLVLSTPSQKPFATLDLTYNRLQEVLRPKFRLGRRYKANP
jgi:hypothetical protein